MPVAPFDRQKIAVVHSQQPWNQYAGGGTGREDSEQRWMRDLAIEVVALLRATGHEVIMGPVGADYSANVAWVNAQPGIDLLLSLHSNATGTAGDSPKGIGVYHHPSSAKGAALAPSLADALRPASASGKAYVSTLTVAELSSTYPPALLVENEFHDWAGTASTGGAAWIRDPGNRARLAQAYRDWVVSRWGAETKPPVVTPPPVEPARTLSVKLMSTNARIDTAPDTGRFRWLARRAAYLALLRKEAPSLILFQELNDKPAKPGLTSMQQYVFGKLAHLGKSCPSKGNRPIGYDKTKWRLTAERAVELSPRGWAHFARVERDGFALWLVNVHLSTDEDTRNAQLAKLTRTLAGLPGAVVVAGDFNQAAVSLPGFRDAVKVAGKVTNRTARTLHGWRTQKYDSRHIDKVLVRDGDTTKISVRYLNVILTSPADETDHNALCAGLTLTVKPSDL